MIQLQAGCAREREREGERERYIFKHQRHLNRYGKVATLKSHINVPSTCLFF